MIDRYYRIAGRTVLLSADSEDAFPELAGFEAEEKGAQEITAELYWERKSFQLWYGVEYRREEPEYPHLFMSRKHPGVRLLADRTWGHMIIEGVSRSFEGVMEVFLTAFYSRLALEGCLLVHASCVSYQGEGLVFTAPSGTGKTTQAELWNQWKGAEILNGDKVILECRNGRCFAWGSPWKGSSPYGLNKSVPLRAVVVLAQGRENVIRRLEGAESVSLFYPHIFWPSWDGECAVGAMETLDVLMNQVPVYHLSCLPDRSAVHTAYCNIWGDAAK